MPDAQPTAARPLVVYLDSSDFSDLSNPQGNRERALAIKGRLEAWSEARQIEIRYSMTHIMEALAVDEKALEFAGLRLACIQELCGTKVLMDAITLMTHELSSVENPQVFDDEGGWFPLAVVAHKWQRENAEGTALNRQERRQLAAKLRASRPTFDLAASLDELSASFPFKRESAADILKNPYGFEVFQRALNDSLKDLNHLFAWHRAHWNRSTEFSGLLRASGAELGSLVSEGAQQAGERYRELTELGIPEQEIDQRIQSLAKQVCEEAPQRLIDAFSDDLAPRAAPIHASLDKTPALFVLSKLVAHLVKSSVLPRKQARTPKTSDLGDVLHALYLPYVDFFRADAATAHAINNQHFGLPVTLVTSLDKLIEAIENRLHERAAPPGPRSAHG
ncbi:hypothetical protein [Pseudomonas chlororaphis]|uniref:Uncharacterized protein n=1 Tax=Pseudomonas chlororaphis TaxID=587753 RepID=A0A1Q8EMG3_9PSED|nr:hypothetical protein [Pseudomonas chlororaphis]OLF52957.1 hypothetical protein BTN82_19515 [Pseudomonas chlororaphis]